MFRNMTTPRSGAVKRAISYFQDCFADPRCFYYFWQKGLRIVGLRRFFGRTLAAALPQTAGLRVDDQTVRLVKELADIGYSYVTDLIQPSQVEEIRQYLRGKDCSEVGHPEYGKFRAPDEVPPHGRKLAYDLPTLLRCPHLLEIANHPVILRAVERMLGCKPTLAAMDAWWSMGGRTPDPDAGSYRDDLYHRDVEDFRFVKLFVYLTEVDKESGPHIFVRGSHRDSKLIQRRPWNHDEVVAAFGTDAIQTFVGARGTAFLENTWGIHRAYPAKSKDRLIYSVTYTLTGWSPNTPRQPLISLEHERFDRYINRCCLASRTR
jgi:hypothetical protein